MRRFVTIAAATLTTLALSASPALAGGAPGGPGNIVPPAGFVRQYDHQAAFVARTCNGSPDQVNRAAAKFAHREARLDQKLAKAGLPASPTYFDFANLTYKGIDLGCAKG